MITQALGPDFPELTVFVVWTLIAFGCGVSWAAYRALGWVDRMRAWAGAHAAPAPSQGPCVADAPVPAVGEN